MARETLRRDGIHLQECAVFALRKLDADWLSDAGVVERYPASPSFTVWGQSRFLNFYRRAAARLTRILERQPIERIYLVNSDNLLCSHALEWCASHPDVVVTVLVEGLMNFQDIQMRNRAWWRGAVKPVVARLLGTRWRLPHGHLSGAYEPEVDRVVSFSDVGLQAPPEKVELLTFSAVRPKVVPRPNVAVLAQTGIWQWMSEPDRQVFADAYVDWIRNQRFDGLFVKRHPHYDTSFLEKRLPEHQVIGAGMNLEDMAADLPGEYVISTNCTALVTLRMLRPDLRCIDFGWNYYCQRAYFGDESSMGLLRAAGVELVATATAANAA